MFHRSSPSILAVAAAIRLAALLSAAFRAGSVEVAQSGFSLLEMMAVFDLILIMATIWMLTYHSIIVHAHEAIVGG